eukprot:6066118-Pleurochrysis_carterae.AAC.1
MAADLVCICGADIFPAVHVMKDFLHRPVVSRQSVLHAGVVANIRIRPHHFDAARSGSFHLLSSH